MVVEQALYLADAYLQVDFMGLWAYVCLGINNRESGSVQLRSHTDSFGRLMPKFNVISPVKEASPWTYVHIHHELILNTSHFVTEITSHLLICARREHLTLSFSIIGNIPASDKVWKWVTMAHLERAPDFST